ADGNRSNILSAVKRFILRSTDKRWWSLLRRHLRFMAQSIFTEPAAESPARALTFQALDKPSFQPEWDAWFRRWDVDLLCFLGTVAMPFEASIPYVLMIHDLQHRLQPEFPEVSAGDEWGRREYYFHNGLRYATLILTDSEVGKEDILR